MQIRRRICVFSVFIHHFEQGTDSGLKINLLQEYNFIALDIFRKNIYNKEIQNELEAWLTFLSVDDPEMIAPKQRNNRRSHRQNKRSGRHLKK